MTEQAFVPEWRRLKSAAFDLHGNSTAKRTVSFELWSRPVEVYANANLSIYSAQPCNAKCHFCVEELRPASRGAELELHKTIEHNDAVYFAALEETLRALKPLDPSVSITGGEPSRDPRLPRVLEMLRDMACRKRTMTTNASGLLHRSGGRRIVDWVVATGIEHLNISRAHIDHDRNALLMRMSDGLKLGELREAVRTAREADTRVRLSCVLLRGEIDSVEGIRAYLEFAQSLGVNNVIFRQLMQTDPETVVRNHVVRYSDRQRVQLECLLDQLSGHREFSFVRQVIGYYYYVEVWRYQGMDVVFEEADLARLEMTKRTTPGLIHELVFHPSGQLASTWQPWDGVIGPSRGRDSNVRTMDSQPLRIA